VELLLQTWKGGGKDCDVTTVVGIMCKIMNYKHVGVFGRCYNAGQFGRCYNGGQFAHSLLTAGEGTLPVKLTNPVASVRFRHAAVCCRNNRGIEKTAFNEAMRNGVSARCY
jgi:hypothetical protein